MSTGEQSVADQLRTLATTSENAAKYLQARQHGFSVVGRGFRYADEQLHARLVLSNGAVDLDLESDEQSFVWLALSHRFASDCILLANELGAEQPRSLSEPAAEKPAITFDCGLLRLTQSTIQRLELTESVRERKLSYRLWTTQERARLLRLVPTTPSARLTIEFGSILAHALHGYIDAVTPFLLGGEGLVEIAGTDFMYGCRNLVAGLFNARVDPATSITLFAAWLDLGLVTSAKLHMPPGLEGLDSIPKPSGLAAPALRSFLRCFSEKQEKQSIKQLCGLFQRALDQNPDGAPLMAQAFRNVALTLHNEIPLYVAVGSVRGLGAAPGIMCLAPGIVVAAADQLPFSLLGKKRDIPLCQHWDGDAARLVTFFASTSAPNTVVDGWKALTRAHEFLVLAVADAGWLHADAQKNLYPMIVDGRVQDAVLELDHWYHVHHLASGTAHQYYARQDKSSNKLALETRQSNAISPRLQLLMGNILKNKERFPILTAHLSQAMTWLTRSRDSATPGEEFLCLWIAVEYLVVPARSGSAIKGTIGPRLAELMGGSDRTMRRFWQAKFDECYELRCKIVHEAADDRERIASLAPILRQAVIEAIWFCVLTIRHLVDDAAPATLLARTSVYVASKKDRNASARTGTAASHKRRRSSTR